MKDWEQLNPEYRELGDEFAQFLLSRAATMKPDQAFVFIFHIAHVLLHETFHMMKRVNIPRDRAVAITRELFQIAVTCSYGKKLSEERKRDN